MDAMGVAGIVAGLRESFENGVTKPIGWRVRQLRALRRLLTESGHELEEALAADLGKSGTETQITEIGVVVAEIDHTLKNLRRWLRPRAVPVPASVLPARASIVLEPLGVVAVIAPWNYPVQLLLSPAVGALAAGNALVLKPSELAPATSACLERLIGAHLDPRAVRVVSGGAEETTELLAGRLDHVFYTGGARVGRIVMAAAAERLTPVTLELGGKCPVFVDDDVDLTATARRIVWGKFMNAGQTCVAPDYLLAAPRTAEALEPLLEAAIREFYGANPRHSPDFGRIVNDAHVERLSALLGSGRIVTGGEVDAGSRYIAPTILADVPADSPIMREEIFGPILPLLTVEGPGEAIREINGRPKPLALYVFSGSESVRRRFLTGTSSGAVGFGAPTAHLIVSGLPFGGVGLSGMGAYHGRRSLVTFSHEKAVLRKPLSPDTLALVYPPFTAAKDRFARTILRRLG